MRITRAMLAACVTLGTTEAISAGARADAPTRAPEDVARAEARFHEGERLFDAKQVPEACAAFDESERLDPQLGTLLNLAFCQETLGKTASAWRAYSAGAVWGEQRGQHDRAAWALSRASDVSKRLPLVLLALPAGTSAIRGATIQIDDDVVPASGWFTPLPLDPGEHTLQVSAPGHRSQQIALHVNDGPSTQSVSIPVLEVLPATPSLASGEAPQPSSRGEGQRVVGWVGLGVGVAALGLGTAFGILTLSKKSDASGHCAGTECDATGVADQDEAHRDATVSTLAFGVGLVSLGIGAWLTLTAGPSSPRPSSSAPAPPSLPPPPAVRAAIQPLLGPRLAGVGMVGTW